MNGVEKVNVEDNRSLRERIYDVLRDYRQIEVGDEEGYGYPLVDALTLNGHSIDMGEREIQNIADILAHEIENFYAAKNSAAATDQQPVAWRCFHPNAGRHFLTKLSSTDSWAEIQPLYAAPVGRDVLTEKDKINEV